MKLKKHATILFIGDSITDAGRSRDDDSYLGNGFVNLINAELRYTYPQFDLTVFNRGIGGNRVKDLRARWETDCVALQPDFLTIFVGINDTWRRYDSNDPTSTQSYEADYRHILEQVSTKTNAAILLMEPFVLPTPPDRIAWREDLDPRIQVVRRLALEFKAALIPLDDLFTAATACSDHPSYWAADGVHPTAAGHALITKQWLKTFHRLIQPEGIIDE